MTFNPLEQAALEAEYGVIVETLKKTNFSKRKAAKILDVDPKTISNKLQRHIQLQAYLKSKKRIKGK